MHMSIKIKSAGTDALIQKSHGNSFTVLGDEIYINAKFQEIVQKILQPSRGRLHRR